MFELTATLALVAAPVGLLGWCIYAWCKGSIAAAILLSAVSFPLCFAGTTAVFLWAGVLTIVWGWINARIDAWGK